MEDPHSREEEIGEYRSKDLDFEGTEPYEPEYPLTRAEERLLELNAKGVSPVEWLKTELAPIVSQELDRTDKEQE